MSTAAVRSEKLSDRTKLAWAVIDKARALVAAPKVWDHLGPLRKAVDALDEYEKQTQVAGGAGDAERKDLAEFPRKATDATAT